MRRRHPDERCGLCEAAPFRPCAAFWFDFREELRGGLTHFQPAGFTTELPVEHQAKSSGRLATDFERMARDSRVARSRDAIEEAIPGFLVAWDSSEKPAPRSDSAVRSRLSATRAAGKLGAR